jgi:hypothetical protein
MFATLGEAAADASIQVPAPMGKTDHRKADAAMARRPIGLCNYIRDRAHEKWVKAGGPLGDCVRFWLEAEQELLSAR